MYRVAYYEEKISLFKSRSVAYLVISSG